MGIQAGFLLAVVFTYLQMDSNEQAPAPCALMDEATGVCSICSLEFFKEGIKNELEFFPTSDCKPRETSSNFTKNVWVSNKACTSSLPCTGDKYYPFDSIFSALKYLDLAANRYLYSFLNIFLLDTEHYVVANDLAEFNYRPHFFKGMMTEITISPWFCDMEQVPGCLGSRQERTKINLKTNDFFMFFSEKLEIQNINFEGTDLHTQLDNDSSQCYNQKGKTCCTKEDLIGSGSPCSLQWLNYAPKPLRGKYLGMLIPENSFLKSKPRLSILNSAFIDMYLIARKDIGFYSLIHISDESRFDILIEGTAFINVNFEYGIVYLKPSASAFSSSGSDSTGGTTVDSITTKQFTLRGCSFVDLNKYFVSSIGDSQLILFYFSQSENLVTYFSESFIIGPDYQGGNIKKLGFIFIMNAGQIFLRNFKIESSNLWRFLNAFSSIIEIRFLEIALMKFDGDNSIIRSDQSSVQINNLFIRESNFYNGKYAFFLTQCVLQLSALILENVSNLTWAFSKSTVSGYQWSFINSFTRQIFLEFNSSSLTLVGIKFVGLQIHHTKSFLLGSSTILEDAGFLLVKDAIIKDCHWISEVGNINKFINWRESKSDDEVVFQNLTIDNLTSFPPPPTPPYITFFETYFIPKLRSSEILIINVNFPFTFIFLNEINDFSMQNCVISNVFVQYYIMSLICNKMCNVSISNLSICDIKIQFNDVFYLVTNGLLLADNLMISRVSLNELKALFIMMTQVTAFISNVNISIDDLPSDNPLSQFFDVSNIFNISFVNFTCVSLDPTLNLSYSGIISMMVVEYINLINLTVKNFGCMVNISDFFKRNGIINVYGKEFEKDINVIGNVYLLEVIIGDCFGCLNGIIALIDIVYANIANCTISKSETLEGGAIYIRNSGDIELVDVQAIDLRSLKGGAVWALNLKSLTCFNLQVQNSTASLGGAAWITFVEKTVFDHCEFMSTYAETEGGAIYIKESSLEIKGGNINNATAPISGGAIFSTKSSLKLSEKFEALNCFAESGGFLTLVEGSKLEIDDVQIYKVQAVSKGSVLNVYGIDEVLINRLLLQRNQVSYGSGSIVIETGSRAEVVISNIECLENLADEGSCFLLILDSTIIFQNVKMSNNHGVVMMISPLSFLAKPKVIINELSVELSEKVDDSFQIPDFWDYYLHFKQVELFVESLTLVDTNRGIFHAIIGLEESTFRFSNVKFTTSLKNNIDPASYPGLFEFRISNGVVCNMTYNASFQNNLAFLYMLNTNLSIENGLISGCRTLDNGCFYADNSNIMLINVKFKECAAYISGAVYLSSSDLNCSFCVFEANSIFYSSKFSKELNSNDIWAESSNSIIINNSVFFENKGLAFRISKVFSAIIALSEFRGKGLYSSRALYLFSSTISIFASNFSKFDTDSGGCIYALKTDSIKPMRKIEISQSSFTECNSNRGGVFYFIGEFSIIIKGNFFTRNEAYIEKGDIHSGVGGVGLFICQQCANNYFFLKFNFFNSNKAGLLGSTIISQAFIFHNDLNGIDTNIYENNQEPATDSITVAIYFPTKIRHGPVKENPNKLDLARSKPGKLLAAGIIKENQEKCKITSGEPFQYLAILTDSQGIAINSNFSAKASFKEGYAKSENMLRLDKWSVECYGGVCFFPELKVNTNPDSDFFLIIRIEYKFTSIFPENPLEFVEKNISFYSLPCARGELYIGEDQSCYRCPEFKYSLLLPLKPKRESDKCVDCPLNAVCPGGDVITPIPGYWRASASSTLILGCIAKDDCLGNALEIKSADNIHGACREHQFGILCYSCEKGYAKISSKGSCIACKLDFFFYAKLIAALIAILIYIIMQVNITFRANVSTNAGILLKQLLNHFQQVGMISLIDLGWTPDIINYFEIQKYLAFISEEFITIDCLIEDLGYDMLTQKILFTNVLPILLSILIFFFWLITFYFHLLVKRSSNYNMKIVFDRVRVSVMVIVYLLFPRILSKSLSLLSCIVIDDDISTRVLQYSPEIRCWQTQHIKFLLIAALPGLLVWGVLTPVFIFYLLEKYKKYIFLIIKKFKRDKKQRVQNIEVLNIIDNIKTVTVNKLKSQPLSFSTLRQIDEQSSKSIQEPIFKGNLTIRKRNNFFERKGFQENSAEGVTVTEYGNFFKLNSLGKEKGTDAPNDENGGENARANEPEPASPSKKSGSNGYIGSLVNSSFKFLKSMINIRPLSEKENREIRRENGLMLQFLYRGYAPRFYYWELVMFSKKFFLIFIGSFNDFFPSTSKALILMVLLSFYIFLQAKFQPLENSQLNNVEIYSLVVSFLTANLGMMLFTEDLRKSSSGILILILMCNVGYITYWIYSFYSQVIQYKGFRRFMMDLLNYIPGLLKRRKII